MILKRNNQNVGKCYTNYTNFWKKLKSITVNIEICIHEKYGKDNKAFSVICESEHSWAQLTNNVASANR